MSASPGMVLAGTAVVSSPMLLLLQEGQISLDDALLRVVVCLALCWVALSVVGRLAFSPAPVRREEPVPDLSEPPAEAPLDVR